MEITAEAEAEERRREHWKLLSSLKTTVEGLVSTNNPNVWSRYGGLQRLHKDMNHILSHGLKHEQVYYKQKDYWPFVWCVRYISPHLASHVEQFSKLEPVLSSGMQSVGEGYKAERWLLHSLQVHLLSAQLRPLLKHQGHTRKYYNEEAFLLKEPHVTAMFQYLEAVEQNNPRLLALVDTVRLSTLKGPQCVGGLLKSQSLCVLPGAGGGWRAGLGKGQGPPREELNRRLTTSQCSLPHQDRGHTLNSINTGVISERNSDTIPSASAPGAPWGCVSGSGGEGERGVTPPPGPLAAVPRIALTEPASPGPVHSDTLDSGEGDDGPEYLAIGNLGQRCNRRESQNSTPGHEPSSEPSGGGELGGEVPVQPPRRSSLAVVPPSAPRRSSFSEGQRGQGRGGSRGHIRSMSDTGINHKHRHGGGHRKITIIIEDPVAESLVGEDCCVKAYSPFCPVISDVSTPSSLYLESNGSQYSGIPDGMFRKPSEGQSLISYLSEQDFGSCADLEKENAHFSISESLIAAIELMKCNLRRRREEEEDGDDSDSEIQHGGSRRSSQDSFHMSDSGSAEEVEECELRDADIKRSVTSSGRSFLSSESISPSFLQSNSAESHADIYKLRIRVRGNLEWAPPRPQIIFNIHPAPKRKIVVAKQNYRCAGCGTRIDPDYIKRMRYCEYLGRYFCQCCHENAQAVVPGRVLRKWDFSKYYVSNFARDLLGKIAGDPLFNPNDINSGLYKKNKALETVRVLRVQLFHMKNLFKTCRLSKDVLDQFDSLPGHLTEDLHLFSLNDLSAVRNGELATRLRELLKLGSMHVAGCVLCQAKECNACFHSKCFQAGKECPRCQRLAERRERMARKNMEEQEDKEEDEGGGS
ncbi:unnamed protein product [Coregonus sp. 'balchen']|nr:unnamed protein product [Coregonus sp. 'balchen']